MGRVFSFAVALALTGCGTASNLIPKDGRPPPLEVYGGVSQSVETLRTACGDLVSVPYAPFLVPDVALSAIGDTITLPITLVAAVHRSIIAYYLPEEPTSNGWRKFWFNEPQPEPPPQQAGATGDR
jgi:uncharacterized protein YceK